MPRGIPNRYPVAVPPPTTGPTRVQQLVRLFGELTPSDLKEIDAAIQTTERQLSGLDTLRAMLVPPVKDTKVGMAGDGEPPRFKGKGGKKKLALLTALPEDKSAGEVPETNGAEGDVGKGKLQPPMDREAKLAWLRRRVVAFLIKTGRAVRVSEIIQGVPVGPRWINEVLAHPWFTQTNEGVYISPAARQEAEGGD